MMKGMRKVILAVGGTGGHIVPALATRELFHSKGVETLLIGKGLEGHPVIQDNNVAYREIPSGLPALASPLVMLRRGKAILAGYQHSLKVFREFEPDLVVGFGSYHSLPVVLAAARKGLPMFLHEQNVVPGKVNQLFSRFAKGVGVNFSTTAKRFPCPSREVFVARRTQKQHVQCSGSPRICVVGGSQGARILNQIVPRALCQLRETFPNIHVHHIVGPMGEIRDVEVCYTQGEISHCVKHFETHMLDVLISSDLVISRAGATILDELLWAKTPAIFIPYPGAYGHQQANAQFFVENIRGGEMILETELNEKILVKKVMLALDSQTSEARRQSLCNYEKHRSRISFYQFICEHL
ncbi:undecaprenyldiphospho-muramoylpentapeptide beta-N-acetylglucosaminyltransferase [Chlamydia pecorum]|nr:undecaprenyldiphospho-muramoylpentapeptide beta-N-acetylglucosaminyltransferase [Chlamydia pecorum]UFP06746.1 undecaprenyldiphospho-muramoylpentapeptide beta-N-acetylglucosaminyltransferase [Chlamydia pecorum]